MKYFSIMLILVLIGCAAAAATVKTTILSGTQDTHVANGYELAANCYNCHGNLTITDRNSGDDFTVTRSTVNAYGDAGGEPGAYPELYLGNDWGIKSPDNPFPVAVSSITKGNTTVKTSVTTYEDKKTSDIWDSLYDIWYTPTRTGNQSGRSLELCIWLDSHGNVEPAGHELPGVVVLDRYKFRVWWSPVEGTNGTVTYQLVNPQRRLVNFNLAPLTADAIHRGYLPSSWFLVAVEHGFELWRGGAGNQAGIFGVTVKSLDIKLPAWYG